MSISSKIDDDDLFLYMCHVLDLKKVKRSGWIRKVGIEDSESVADHCYSMCMLVMILANRLNFSIEKTFKMILLHDLAESIIGDIIPCQIPQEEKNTKECKAMDIIFSYFPSILMEEYKQLWTEYLDNSTDLSKFVHNIDKLEMALQAQYYINKGYSRGGLSEFIESAKNYVTKNETQNRSINEFLCTSLNSLFPINSDMQYFMALKLGEKRVKVAQDLLSIYTGRAMPALALKDNHSNSWEPVGEEINYAVAKEENGYLFAFCDNHGIAKSVAQWFAEDEKEKIVKKMIDDKIPEYIGKLFLPI